MVLVQNKYKNTLVGVLRTQITFVTHLFFLVCIARPTLTTNSGNYLTRVWERSEITVVRIYLSLVI